MAETIDNLTEIVYLSDEKYIEYKEAGLLDENTIYITPSGIMDDVKTLKNQVSSLQNITSNLDNAVYYKDFEYDGEIRKTIQLDNFDSISGIDTTGNGHNLVMLSKWDVADFGSSKIHSNINTKTKFGSGSAVTINDNEVIITDKLLSSILANNGNVKYTIQKIEVDDKEFYLYDLNVDLSNLATKEELDNAFSDADQNLIKEVNELKVRISVNETNIQLLKVGLNNTNQELANTKQELANTNQELENTKIALNNSNNRIEVLEGQIVEIKSLLADISSTIDIINGEVI